MLLVRRNARLLCTSQVARAFASDATQRFADPGARERSQELAAHLDSFEEEELDGDETFLATARAASDEAAANPALQRTVRVAVIGAPNSGKSTLTNTLVGQLVSAVSKKTNTTRVETLGAATFGDTQLVLHDTPGVVSQVGWHGMAHATRVKSAWHAAADADVALFLVDAHRQVEEPDPRVALLISSAAEHLMPPVVGGASRAAPRSVLVLNKTDALRPAGRRLSLLRGLLNDLAPMHAFDAMYAVSSLKHHGCGALVKQLLAWAQPVPWPLPPNRAADRGPVAQALAATQGALFERLHEELPYTISLRHVSWTEFKDGSARVEQTLLVPTQAVRKIVVGKDGASIGQIGIAARKVCEEMFGRRIHLILNVKVARGRRASSPEGPDSMVDTFEDDNGEKL